MVRPPTIVVCDDNQMLRWSLVWHLEQSGYRCETASNGYELLQLLENSEPTLVLLDLEMPRMGGLEALRYLHECGPHPPVIVMTGSGDSARSQATALGAVSTIAKPFALDDMGELVRSCLSHGA
ncbi:MAG: response regulator [Myxococcota bacterium]